MAEAGSPVVELRTVRHRYRATTALDDVSLTLPGGQMIGLIGPDGVGKSTLLALVAGVRKIQQGEVKVLGANLAVREQRAGVVGRVAYMPQGLGRNLYPSLSVQENLGFFGRLFGLDQEQRRARIDVLLAATGLTEFRARRAANLSGGMKQKLALCCALLHEPELLILDEPTTGVDPLSRRRFWELIDRLRQRRPDINILVATAYMEEAERFDWLVAMNDGKVLASGTAADLKSATGASDMEGAFVALLPGQHGRMSQAPPAAPAPAADDGPPAIEAEQLTHRFGDFTAVDRVSFRIRRGEIFGFLGSNGCGKTTTMRMLTGLLPVTEGEARIFGEPVDASDQALRLRVGFMSQGFSLYDELSVRQNLELHAHLYRLTGSQIRRRITELVERFELQRQLDTRALELPLGLRQRLSLAVAVIHEPELLILDEPTSGVDPLARDGFWQLLLELSRRHGVTIFVSTHFMNEAERCDRISLMHAGRVLAQGRPEALRAAQDAATLEDAFIAYLEEADTAEAVAVAAAPPPRDRTSQAAAAQSCRFCLNRLFAYARREATELWRDPIRMAFALLGPIFLMIAMGYGISFDVEHIRFAVQDWDRTPESRAYIEQFEASRYFARRPDIVDDDDMIRRLRADQLTVAIEIPPRFARDLKRGRRPEIGFLIDGAIPFRGETIRGYVQGAHQQYLEELARRTDDVSASRSPVTIETRFRYNQSFRSVYAMVPGILMLLLIMIPATMTAVGVVREKELGSISNLYATPTTGIEFLLGKQLPYIGIALASYLTLTAMTLWLFQVPLKGSLLGLTLGALLFVFASTGLGLLMSTFMRTQIAAIFGTAIASVIPTILFSGMLSPVASLTGPARIMGYGFPSSWFNHVSVGSFTKGLGPAELWHDYLALAGFGLAFLALGRALLRTQER
jgi:ribosome-dependent ATPase